MEVAISINNNHHTILAKSAAGNWCKMRSDDAENKIYYYNTETRVQQEQPPEEHDFLEIAQETRVVRTEGDWVEVFDPSANETHWFNAKSNETRKEKPNRALKLFGYFSLKSILNPPKAKFVDTAPASNVQSIKSGLAKYWIGAGNAASGEDDIPILRLFTVTIMFVDGALLWFIYTTFYVKDNFVLSLIDCTSCGGKCVKCSPLRAGVGN